VHPIERLRYVARTDVVDAVDLAVEAADALGAFIDDPAGLVAAARRLVARHGSQGPMWWLCSRVLVAPDAAAEGRRAAADLLSDTTASALAAAVPDEARLLLIGWPPTVINALGRRGDLTVLAADDGTRPDVSRVLGRVDIDIRDVQAEGVGEAAASVDIVLLEADAVGPGNALAVPGSRAAAAVASAAGRSVWLVAPVGRVLPGPLFDAVQAATFVDDEPWDSGHDLLPLSLVDRIVGPDGPCPPEAALGGRGRPVAPELLRSARTPGSQEH
jgi:hypothetical protein